MNMHATTLQAKVIEEIQRVPEDKLTELYAVIHFFRVGVETVASTSDDLMQFAGCWQDMPDEEFREFLTDLAERRQQAFSRRRGSETSLD